MIGLGTIINTATILAGGMIGILFKNALSDRFKDAIVKSIGLCVMFISIGGAMQEMLKFQGGSLSSQGGLLLILSMVLGAVVGTFIDLEKRFENFGEWLKKKSKNQNDSKFLDAFVSASFTVCIGAMAIIGSIQDGLSGDYSLLLTKSILDFVSVLVITSSVSTGAIFSVIPMLILQGGVTLLARFIKPILTVSALSALNLVGSVLIFCVGINFLWPKKIQVANMLPSIIFAIALSFIM